MKAIKLFFFSSFCGLLLFSITGKAQTANLSGKVVNQNSIAIKAASIEIENTTFKTITDTNGYFVLKNIPIGKYKILAFTDGSRIFKKHVSLDKDLEINIELKEIEHQLDEVNIKNKDSEFGIGRLKSVDEFGIYEGKKTEVITLKNMAANLSTNNPRQIYGKVTGLNIWESDGAGLQLGIGGRGLSPNRTANFNVRQNGYDISADALGYPESYYTPPSEALEKIEIVRGAASLQYGTQFGGLLNFKFQKGPANKKLEYTTRQSIGSWGFLNSFHSLGGTLQKGKLNYFSFIQYKRGDGYRPNSNFNYINAFTSVDYAISTKLNIGLEFTKMQYLARQPGGLTDRNFKDNPRQSVRNRNWFFVDWNLLALTATYQFSPSTKLNTRTFGLMASRKALGNLERINVVDFGQNRNLIDGNFQNLGNETRLLHHYSLKNGNLNSLIIGSRVYLGNTSAFQGTGSSGRDAKFSRLPGANEVDSDYRFPNQNLAFFAEHIFQLGSKLTITPGIRLEYIKTSSRGFYNQKAYDAAGNLISISRTNERISKSRHFLLTGVGINYKPSEKMSIYANFSQNYRAINFSDLRIVNPNFIVDPNITDEKGYTADLGIKGKNHWISYELTGFYIFYKGKIGQILKADRPPLFIDYRYRSNIADARNVGIEMYSEIDLTHFKNQIKANQNGIKWSIFTNLAVVNAKYIHTSDKSILNKKVEMVPPLMFRSGLTAGKGAFVATLQFSLVTKHYSDATNAILTSTAVEGIIPGYQVVDLSAKYNFGKLFLEGSLNNLLNQNYFTRRAESYPGPGIIPADGRAAYVTLGAKI